MVRGGGGGQARRELGKTVLGERAARALFSFWLFLGRILAGHGCSEGLGQFA